MLAVTGLLGCLLWSTTEATAAGSESTDGSPHRLLATPVRFQDLLPLLKDPRREMRIQAIMYLETLNRQDRDTIAALTPLFGDSDYGVRVFAVRAAIRAGMPAQSGVPVVTQALVPEYSDVCCIAAQILGDAGPVARDALPNLHACLKAAPIWVRLRAAQAVLKIDPFDVAPVSVLQSALDDESGEPKEFAAHVLDGYIQSQVDRSSHTDAGVRLAAVMGLEQVGKLPLAGTRALVDRLTDADHLVRVHAARAAYRAGVPAQHIVGIVSGLLDPERLDVLRTATLILVEIGPEARTALPKLHECLESSSITVCLHAGEAALRIDPTDRLALKKLRKALRHPQADVRYFAVNALGTAVMESDVAALALHRSLLDPDAKVSTAAGLHLSRSHDLPRRRLPEDPIGAGKDTGADYVDVAPLIGALSDKDPNVRQSAAICLTIAGPAAREAIPDLIGRLGDSDPVVRLHVVLALWEIDHNGYPIMPVLLDLLLTNRGGTRIGAIYTLGRMGPAASDVAPWLSQMLKESHSIDRLLLAEAIARIELANGESLAILARGVRSRSADVRYLSAVALGAMPLSSKVFAEQEVYGAIGDRSARVRCAAFETLSQLQVRHSVARSKNAVTGDAVIPASATEAAKP